MPIKKYLTDVAVLGAGGKMGRGIALTLLQLISFLPNPVYLRLIDDSDSALASLPAYLRLHLTRFAEKQINRLRTHCARHPTLVSNEEVVRFFVQESLDRLRLSTRAEEAGRSKLIFEAVAEDLDLKAKLLKVVNGHGGQNSFFFTNTSSIPISELSRAAGIKGRLIGFHFYNPPAVQKLIELIPPDGVNPDLRQFAEQLAVQLQKQIVVSKDAAGFIGNGYLLRELDFACRQLALFGRPEEAIAIINQVTEQWLLRPMGIFQLADYVGLDICQNIAAIMKKYLAVELDLGAIDRLAAAGSIGGQGPDGMQRNGFFHYEKKRPVALFSWDKQTYLPLPKLPFAARPWGELPKHEPSLNRYFEEVFTLDSQEADLARRFLINLQTIAETLVSDGVAADMVSVDTVLKNGFGHLYGPGEIKR